MQSRKIYLDDPNIGSLEKEYINRAIDSRFVSTAGPFVPEFEETFAKFLHVDRAVSTQSGTAAIHVALHELGIGAQYRFCSPDEGMQTLGCQNTDEVIVPALTFAATVNPVLHIGAVPVFVDVDADTWNIDPEALEQVITEHTKAIMPVHLYGNPCRMEAIMEIAKKYNLYVIEDATESLGATYQGQYTGTFGVFGAFSFNGNKIITTGGGGMVVGHDEKRLDHIKFLVNQAREQSKGYYHPEIGFNYRMTNIEAALGLAQMERLDEFLSKKREFHEIYREELRNIKGIQFQEASQRAISSWWFSGILVENSRDISALQKQLKNKGIPTRRIFMPIVEFPPYQRYKRGRFQNSYHIYEQGLCLPSSTLNSQDDIYYVCQKIKERV